MSSLWIWIYIGLMALTTFAIRVLPMLLIRKPIENVFIRSFLFYVPYVTLSVMTFPAILEVTQSPVSGLIAFIVGVIAAWFGGGLFTVALLCCSTVYLLELLL